MNVDFIDSNVFVYLFDERAPDKARTAAGLLDDGLRDGTAVISFQVVQETLAVITRKLDVNATPEEAARLLDKLLFPLCRIFPSKALYHSALDIKQRYHYRFCDSLIIAAALEAGCRILLSEDMQHGQRIDGRLTLRNPFAENTD